MRKVQSFFILYACKRVYPRLRRGYRMRSDFSRRTAL